MYPDMVSEVTSLLKPPLTFGNKSSNSSNSVGVGAGVATGLVVAGGGLSALLGLIIYLVKRQKETTLSETVSIESGTSKVNRENVEMKAVQAGAGET